MNDFAVVVIVVFGFQFKIPGGAIFAIRMVNPHPETLLKAVKVFQ